MQLKSVLAWLVKTQIRTAIKYNFTQYLPKPCDKLLVRPDIYCLTKAKRDKLIGYFQELYRDGTLLKLSATHNMYWPAGHKTAEFIPFHKAIQKKLY